MCKVSLLKTEHSFSWTSYPSLPCLFQGGKFPEWHLWSWLAAPLGKQVFDVGRGAIEMEVNKAQLASCPNGVMRCVPSQSLTWNLKMAPCKRRNIDKPPILSNFWVPTVKLQGFKFLNWVAPPSPYISKRFPYISLQNHCYKSRLGRFYVLCIKLFLLSFQENNLGRELSWHTFFGGNIFCVTFPKP